MVLPLKTREAARWLGVSYWRLVSLLRCDKLTPLPQKDSSGDFVWFPEDLERARAALKIDRRRKAHHPHPEGAERVA
jgi:hypothetical protein